MQWRTPIGAGLVLAILVAVALQLPLWSWNVEDAAISFGYARNIAAGHGPVPYPGAVPVEGYSNFAWVALLVPSFWLGMNPFVTVPLLGMVLTGLSVWFVHLGARPTLGDRGGLAVAWVFGTFAQTTIWAQSGLENALYSFFLTAGVWRLQVDGRRPWAALCFLGLALTRPEAPLISGLAALTAAMLAVSYGPSGVAERVKGWVLWALVPLVLYHTARYFTFAAEFPATYYAKVHTDRIDVWMWERRSWAYLRSFAIDTGFAVWIPAVLLGFSGMRGWRGWVAVAAGVAYLGGLGWTFLGTPPPAQMVPALCALAAVALALTASRGGIAFFVAAVGLFGLVFSLASTGDWMRGWRWLSLVSLPIAWGVGAFIHVIHDRAASVRPWMGAAVASFVLVGWTAQQASISVLYADRPETSPYGIKKRVSHYLRLMDTLQLRHRPLVIDQDMGANIYWGGLHYDVRDARGLTDLGFALPSARMLAVDSLLTENVYERPTFIHLHAATRRTVAGRRWFRKEYIEVPGYPSGATSIHDQQYVRREVLMGEWDGPARPKSFQGLDVHGWRSRAPEVTPGAGLFFEIAVSLTEPATDDLALWLVAQGPNGVVQTWALPLGYGLFGPSQWKVGEVFVGKYPLLVPPELPLGTYKLALVAVDGDGVRPLTSTRSPTPMMTSEEAFLGRGLKLVDANTMRREARDDIDRMHEKTRTRSCHSAELRWEDALAHRIRSRDWRAQHEPDARAALAKCWGDRGGRKSDRLRSGDPNVPIESMAPVDYLLEAATDVQRGRTWDPSHPNVSRGARRVATLLEARARTLEARGEWDTAFRFYDLTIRTDPTWVFVQRKVERMRAARLSYEDRLGPLP